MCELGIIIVSTQRMVMSIKLAGLCETLRKKPGEDKDSGNIGSCFKESFEVITLMDENGIEKGVYKF